MKNKAGFVSLVGAGCTEGLISLKGLFCISKADIILYDDLIDEALLSNAGSDCELIYVGKRSGRHSLKQEEINSLLVNKALSGKYVVRLKGGDPFVLGRGGEETAALIKEGIAYELLPGVTSAVAVPELLGIPVTHRGVSRSFTVITGHTKSDADVSYSDYAKVPGTLVFLMGINNAGKISAELMAGGMSGDTPAAIVSYTEEERSYRIDCTLNTLERAADSAYTPGIIVIGRVCSLHLRDNERKSVLAIGSNEFTDKCMSLFYPKGFRVKKCHVFTLNELAENIPDGFESGSLIVFTSARGVEVFFKNYLKDKDIRSLANIKFACIGEATAVSLSGYGIKCDIIPKEYTSASLTQAVANGYKGKRVYILRSRLGSPRLREELEGCGYELMDCHIYDMERLTPSIEAEYDYYVFGSAEGARAYFESGNNISKGKAAAIGEVTAAALKEYISEDRLLIAAEATTEGIYKRITEDID